MKKYSLLIALLIGLPIVVLIVIFLAKNPTEEAIGNEDMQLEEGMLYVRQEEGGVVVDIEVAETDHRTLNRVLFNRIAEIETVFRDEVANLEVEEDFGAPLLKVRASIIPWGHVNAVLEVATYTGGAHDFPYVETYVYSPGTDQIITLDDVFNGSRYLPEVARLVRGKLADRSDVFDAETIRFATEPQSENYDTWIINEDGIVFFFNPYEVAPFAAGIIDVLIPWEEMEGLIEISK